MPSQDDLSSRDIQVLKAIADGLSDPKSVASRINAKTEAVISSAEALSEHGLIEVDKQVSELFSLTKEGLLYVNEGLPERRILQLIGQGAPISALKDPSLKIGLGWLRKKGWALIDGGMITPTGCASTGQDEEALQRLSRGPIPEYEIEAQALSALKSRGLVSSQTSKSWRYSITNAGMCLAASTAGPVAAEMLKLTSEVIKSGSWKEGRFKPYNVSLPADRIFPGKIHPYQRLLDKMRGIMLEMGFCEIRGETIQSSFWNFDALFQPQDHPAREMQDTFYIDGRAALPDFMRVKEMHERGGDVGSTGWGGRWSEDVARQRVLRTHTTSISIHYLADHPNPPVKAFCIDRVYRREAIDATHTPEFEQLEGVIMDRDVTFGNLLGFLREFYGKMGFVEVRFRPGYFPYTEPSVEPEVWIDGLGWVELGGAGVFRREVTAPFGIDHPVLAWGLGVSRLAMLKLGLKDLRLLYQSSLEWLRETPVSALKSV